MLKPALAKGELQTVGATTTNEYRIIEKNAALERRFQPMMVDEPSVEDDRQMLRGLRNRTTRAIITCTTPTTRWRAAARLSARYVTDRFLPDKAIDLIDEAGSQRHLELMSLTPDLREMETDSSRACRRPKRRPAQTQDYEKAAQVRAERIALEETFNQAKARWQEERNLNDTVDEEQIASIVARWTGIPVTRMQERESEKLLQMEARLHERVVGQEEAIARSVRCHPPQPLRPQGPAPPHRQLHLPGTDRRRQDRAGQDAGLVPLR